MSRLDRVKALQQTLNDYVKAEQKRINNQVSVLEAIQKGRTGGKGIQEASIQVISAVAQNDLTSYLKGG